MFSMAEVGTVECQNSTIEWIIPKIHLLSKAEDKDHYRCRPFTFASESWHLELHPNFGQSSSWKLVRDFPGPPILLECFIIFKTLKDDKIFEGHYKCVFEGKRNSWSYFLDTKASHILRRRSENVPSDVLTVSCTLKAVTRFENESNKEATTSFVPSESQATSTITDSTAQASSVRSRVANFEPQPPASAQPATIISRRGSKEGNTSVVPSESQATSTVSESTTQTSSVQSRVPNIKAQLPISAKPTTIAARCSKEATTSVVPSESQATSKVSDSTAQASSVRSRVANFEPQSPTSPRPVTIISETGSKEATASFVPSESQAISRVFDSTAQVSSVRSRVANFESQPSTSARPVTIISRSGSKEGNTSVVPSESQATSTICDSITHASSVQSRVPNLKAQPHISAKSATITSRSSKEATTSVVPSESQAIYTVSGSTSQASFVRSRVPNFEPQPLTSARPVNIISGNGSKESTTSVVPSESQTTSTVYDSTSQASSVRSRVANFEPQPPTSARPVNVISGTGLKEATTSVLPSESQVTSTVSDSTSYATSVPSRVANFEPQLPASAQPITIVSRSGRSQMRGVGHNRGSQRRLQNTREPMSLAPDPTEQVRQMEANERMAAVIQELRVTNRKGRVPGRGFGRDTQTAGLFDSPPPASTSGFSFGTTQSNKEETASVVPSETRATSTVFGTTAEASSVRSRVANFEAQPPTSAQALTIISGRGRSYIRGDGHNRGTRRQLQNTREMMPQSPDPVEQVRQVEEDERMARMIQAQFNAEINLDYVTPANHTSRDYEDNYDDDEVEEDTLTDPDWDSDSDESVNPVVDRFPHPLSMLFNLGLDSEMRPRELHSRDIDRLPTRKYFHPNSSRTHPSNSNMTYKRTESSKECPVCLTFFENGDELRILPCFHEFHTPCIDPWLLTNRTCPVCRMAVDLNA